MTRKSDADQGAVRRSPRQERSQHKVELMLEAAIRLLEQSDAASLTTNAIAAKAGISIGTLYQYFENKEALLDALVTRELGAMSGNVVDAVRGAPSGVPGEGVRRTMRAVMNSYGGRSRVHRRLIEHALTRRTGTRLSPLYAQLTDTFASEGIAPLGQARLKLSRAQAYVLTHAVAGVLRSLAASDSTPPLREVEDALVHLTLGYLAALRAARAE